MTNRPVQNAVYRSRNKLTVSSVFGRRLVLSRLYGIRHQGVRGEGEGFENSARVGSIWIVLVTLAPAREESWGGWGCRRDEKLG